MCNACNLWVGLNCGTCSCMITACLLSNLIKYTFKACRLGGCGLGGACGYIKAFGLSPPFPRLSKEVSVEWSSTSNACLANIHCTLRGNAYMYLLATMLYMYMHVHFPWIPIKWLFLDVRSHEIKCTNTCTKWCGSVTYAATLYLYVYVCGVIDSLWSASNCKHE